MPTSVAGLASPISIYGRGLAGLTMAWLLARSGLVWRCVGEPRSSPRTVLLHAQNHNLLGELWKIAPTDLPVLNRIRRRAVYLWPDAPASIVEQASVAVDSESLRCFLEARLNATFPVTCEESSAAEGWRVIATGRAAGALDGTFLQTMGKATCVAVEVPLADDVEDDQVTFERVAGGWLFLIPIGRRRATIQALSEAPLDGEDIISTRLARSRIIAGMIERELHSQRSFDAMPRLRRPCAGRGWIAIGDAAMALPPITGEGIGSALHTAILACAVLRGVVRGEPMDALLRHYVLRVEEAFRSAVARTGYGNASTPGEAFKSSYRLAGFDLIPC